MAHSIRVYMEEPVIGIKGLTTFFLGNFQFFESQLEYSNYETDYAFVARRRSVCCNWPENTLTFFKCTVVQTC